MQKSRLISFILLSLMLPAALRSQELPSLPKDPSVTEGRLASGVGYVVVSDGSMKGSADVVLLQRVCQDAETVPFRNLPLHRSEPVLDSVFVRIFRIISQSIEEDSQAFGTDNQYIVVAGDVKGDAVVKLLEKYGASLQKSESSDYHAPVVPNLNVLPMVSCQDNPDGSSLLSLTKRKPRMNREVLGTVVPLVAMNQDKIAEVILCKSIASSLERLGIPYADLEYSAVRSWMTFGDESFSLSVRVKTADAAQTRDVILTVMGELTEMDLSLNTFVAARNEVWARDFQQMLTPLDNRSQTKRVLAHILHGTPLHSARDGYEFYSSKRLADTTQLRFERSYMAENFKWSNTLGVNVNQARLFTVNARDTLGLPAPSRQKAKLLRTDTDYASGGVRWTFENGTKVIYKRMNTRGALHYSMVFGCGAADVADAPVGESAFYEDMFECAAMDSRTGGDFRRMCEACGIFLDCEVGLENLSLSGSVKTSDLNLLMRVLLAVTTRRQMDPKASAYAIECARLRLHPQDHVNNLLYSRLHPGFAYVPYKSEEGLTPTLASNAETLFAKAFSRADDAVLVLVGDRNEDDVLKVVRRYMDSFKVSGLKKRGSQLTLRTIAGTVAVRESGDPGLSLQISAPVPFTKADYYAARVLEEALNELMEGMGARASISMNLRPYEYADLRITASGDVAREDLLFILQWIIEEDDMASMMKTWKSAVLMRDESARALPRYWVDAASLRFTDAKDVTNGAKAAIDAVSLEKIRSLARVLLGGGCVEYQTR